MQTEPVQQQKRTKTTKESAKVAMMLALLSLAYISWTTSIAFANVLMLPFDAPKNVRHVAPTIAPNSSTQEQEQQSFVHEEKENTDSQIGNETTMLSNQVEDEITANETTILFNEVKNNETNNSSRRKANVWTEQMVPIPQRILPHHSLGSNNNETSGPWQWLAPKIHVSEIPSWLAEYIEFHNSAIHRIRQNKTALQDYNFFIFTCLHREKFRCSGTGNRQRAIAAGFMVAILTRRIFLIHIDKPVRLDSILTPYLIEWNAFQDDNDEITLPQNDPVLMLRNVNPPPLESPHQFQVGIQPPILRYIANGPSSLYSLLASNASQTFFAPNNNFDFSKTSALIGKWIFSTLYAPTPSLHQMVANQQQELGIVPTEGKGQDNDLTSTTASRQHLSYVAVHIRMGNEGTGVSDGKRKNYNDNDVQRYRKESLNQFVHYAQIFRQKIIKENSNKEVIANDGNETQVPIVVLADLHEAKEMMHQHDPQHVRYLNSSILHVDMFEPEKKAKNDRKKRRNKRGKKNNNNSASSQSMELIGSLSVWADVVIMAQSTCFIKSYSSLSRFAETISVDVETGKRQCMCQQMEGMSTNPTKKPSSGFHCATILS